MPDANLLDFTPTEEVFEALRLYLERVLVTRDTIVKHLPDGSTQNVQLSVPAAASVQRFDGEPAQAALAALQNRDETVEVPFVLIGYVSDAPVTLMATQQSGITAMPIMIMLAQAPRGIEHVEADARALDRCQDLIYQFMRNDYLHPKDVKINPAGKGCSTIRHLPSMGGQVSTGDFNFRRLDYGFFRTMV